MPYLSRTTHLRSKYRNKVATLVSLALIVLASSTCTHRSDPQTMYERARQAFLHGDLIGSQQEAAKGREQFATSNPEWSWRFRILEAETMMWRGMSQDVLALLNSTVPPPDRPDLTISIRTLQGVAHARLHQFADADKRLGEAEQLCLAHQDPACGNLLRSQGVEAIERGQFSKAHEFFAQSLSFARIHNDPFLESTALLNLGAASLQQDHFDEAIDWLEPSRQLATTLDAGAVALNVEGNLGWAYYKLGDPERALDSFQKAQSRAVQSGSVIGEEVWLTAIGYVHLDQKNFPVAEQSYQRALGLARQINSREDILNALMSLALVSTQTGQLDQADRTSDEAIEMARTDGNHLDELYVLLVKGQVALARRDTVTAEKLFHDVAQDPAVDVSLKWEAEHSLARLYENSGQSQSADHQYREALATFEKARDTVKREDSQLPFLTNARRIYDDYIGFLVASGKTDEALRWADFSRARTLAEGLRLAHQGNGLQPGPLNAQTIAHQEGGTILFYWLGEEQSYLWAITSRKSTLLRLPPAAEIDARVQRYRKALVGPQNVLDAENDDGRNLYQLLVAPAQKLFPKDSKVFVVPDGSLNGLNFETLLVTEPKLHFWIEDATISQANSLRLLAATASAEPSPSHKLLLIGDPVTSNPVYGNLANAKLEMDSIANHFGAKDERVFTGKQATPSSYLYSDPGQFSHIHFVAHGTASRLSPLESAVVLSQETHEVDSFKLYARDIIRRPLRADLVTISACYGAGARAYSGEGLVGLSWAFLRAGAHNVIGALWEVSDASTPRLMDQLYAELDKGRRPDAALRAAKLSLLHSDGVFRKPFYWAPFQLYTGS